MAGRIEEDSEVRAGLMIVLDGAESQHLGLRGIQVVDDQVEVHLLRSTLSWPVRRHEVVDSLERQAVGPIADVSPPIRGFQLPPQNTRVEGGELNGIRTVDDERGEPGDCHLDRTR